MILLGLALILAKLPRCTMLRALRHDLLIDATVSLLLLVIHYGTFSVVMAATVVGLMTSIATSRLKRLFGYIDGNCYYVGRIRLNV